MGRVVFWGTVGLCALAAGAAMAAPANRCARADEVTAIQTAAIQQQLMVAALTCNQIDNFNAFQIGYRTDLRASDARLLGMFHRLYGFRQGEAEYHAFKTRLANDSSLRSIHDNATYCQQAGAVFRTALAADHPALAQFVSSIQVTDDSPVQSCQMAVALPITGNAPSAIVVPTPNPLRVATLDAAPAPAPAATPTPIADMNASAAAAPREAPVAGTTAAQATNQTPPQDKKKNSGWISSLFN